MHMKTFKNLARNLAELRIAHLCSLVTNLHQELSQRNGLAILFCLFVDLCNCFFFFSKYFPNKILGARTCVFVNFL